MIRSLLRVWILFGALLVALSGCGSDPQTITLNPPEISSVSPAPAAEGDTIVVDGSGFSPEASQNLIVISPGRFSDPVARRVIVPFGGSQTVLRGIVPDGSFTGSVRVEQPDPLGGAFAFGVRPPASPSNLLPFSARLRAGDVGKSFFSGSSYNFAITAGASSEDYLVILFSNAAVPDNTWTVMYEIVAASGALRSAGDVRRVASPSREADRESHERSPEWKYSGEMGPRPLEFQRRVHEEIRDLLERTGARKAAPAATPRPSVVRSSAAPQQTEHFQMVIDPTVSVLDPSNFTTVEAELKHTGAHTLLYVDVETPAQCLTDMEAQNLGQIFDASIYATDRSSFGNESDINGDGKVTILMSPVVNEMTAPGQAAETGFIAGYFLPNDLLPDLLSPTLTNGREIFYSMVPDPTGEFGNIFEKARTLEVIEGVLAHEFLHMILFNYRVLIYGHGYLADYMEELWVEEGLAHIAEDLNGYTTSNILRANLFLSPDPGNVTLIHGGDELAERGAQFLFLRHLGDRFGDPIFKALVQSKKAGTANVEAATGENFLELFADWGAACYLSGRDITDDERFNYSSVDLRGDFASVATIVGNVSGWELQGYVKPMAPEYILYEIPAGMTVEFSIGGEASARMNAIVIRLY